jgi:hypothetical protein
MTNGEIAWPKSNGHVTIQKKLIIIGTDDRVLPKILFLFVEIGRLADKKFYGV